MTSNSGNSDSDNEDSTPPAKDYRDYGRTFARLGDPFEKAYIIVQHGLQMESRERPKRREGPGNTWIHSKKKLCRIKKDFLDISCNSKDACRLLAHTHAFQALHVAIACSC